MPWCVRCDRYLMPAKVPDGTCPRCGSEVERGLVPGMSHPADRAAGETPGELPWHFRLALLALALYLGFRFLEMAEWAWRRL